MVTRNSTIRVANRYISNDLDREFNKTQAPETLLKGNPGHAGAIRDLLDTETNILNLLGEGVTDDRLERRITLTREYLKSQQAKFPTIYNKEFGAILLNVLEQLRRLSTQVTESLVPDTTEKKVAGFRIRNMGWQPASVQVFEAIIRKAAQLISAKGYGSILRGDLQFVQVDQMPVSTGSHALAAYRLSYDDVLISMRIFEGTPLKTLIHELAHRLYFKVMTPAQRDMWEEIFRASRNFPSVYARKSAKEYFAECFAYWCLGKLPKENNEELRKVLP